MRQIKVKKVDLRSTIRRIFKYIPISGAIIGLILGILMTPYKQFSSFDGGREVTLTTPILEYILAIIYSMIATIIFFSFVGCLIVLIILLFNKISKYKFMTKNL